MTGSGALLVILGLLVLAQITKGHALQRLGVTN